MIKIVLTIGLYLSCCYALAQPGSIVIGGNLNTIDSTQIRQVYPLDSKSNPFFELGEIEINSQSDLTRLPHLKPAKSLILDIQFKAIPEALSKAELPNLKSLLVLGYHLEDFEGFPVLESLEHLVMDGFKGSILQIRKKFPNLKSLELVDTHIRYLDFGPVIELKITDCKHLLFEKIPSLESIETLYLFKDSGVLSYSDWRRFTNLKKLVVFEEDLVDIDAHFPQQLEHVTMSYCKVTFKFLEKLKNMKHMQSIALRNSELIWERSTYD